MSEVNNGWIPCTAYNEPPEGFRYDIRYADALHLPSDVVSRGVPWSDRAKRGDYWRPAADEGWTMNDGTKRTGLVDIVNGIGSVHTYAAEGAIWNIGAKCSIIWWRPAASAVTEESETNEGDMSEANEGWIKCTASNEPPEGFGYDVLFSSDLPPSNLSPTSTKWEGKVARGSSWRPAQCDGWVLNDGTEQAGMVDVVFRCGDVATSRESEYWVWGVSDNASSILWWRPSPHAVSEESEPSLLGSLISACEEHEQTRNQCRAANEAIRDVMGDRDRVVMRHGGELYLVEWDDAETVSWQQIEEI